MKRGKCSEEEERKGIKAEQKRAAGILIDSFSLFGQGRREESVATRGNTFTASEAEQCSRQLVCWLISQGQPKGRDKK
jgi:hypothetical protein